MVTIDVTAEDIESAERLMPDSCPIALALRRLFKRRIVRVTLFWIFVGSGQYPTTPLVQRKIDAFDDGIRIKPFSFELDA